MMHYVCGKLWQACVTYNRHYKEGRTALCLVAEACKGKRELGRVHDGHEERYSEHRIKSGHSSECHDDAAEKHIDDCVYCKHVLRLEPYHEHCAYPSSEQEGEHVEEGDTLVIIHSPQAEAKYNQARALESATLAQNEKIDAGTRIQLINMAKEVWSKAKADLELAKTTRQRMINLYNDNVITLEDYKSISVI